MCANVTVVIMCANVTAVSVLQLCSLPMALGGSVAPEEASIACVVDADRPGGNNERAESKTCADT